MEREYACKHTFYKLIDMDKLPVLTTLSTFLMHWKSPDSLMSFPEQEILRYLIRLGHSIE